MNGLRHKKDWGPGWVFFECNTCMWKWKEKSRDCTSLSNSSCPKCHEIEMPTGNEPHYEWPTDAQGNLYDG